MSTGPLYVGIDLGTTNSTAAVFDGERVHLIRNSQGSSLTPSVVRIDARGVVTVGQKARRALETDPANTRAEFKRLMGTGKALDFAAAKVSRTPEALSAEVLKSLRADVQEQLGVTPLRAVISVPALFELPQSAATSEAARLAGFEKVELIQEPVASALAAGWTAAETGGYWLVYDLGGGTFDASLLETSEGMLRVVGHDGDNFLGGRDVDWLIVDWAIEQLQSQGLAAPKRDDPRHAHAIRKLKLAAEEAKIELSRAPEAILSLPGLQVGDELVEVDLVLPRGALDERVGALLDRSIAVCQRLLKAHDVDPAKLERVVLVGGPTAMPVLRHRLRAALGAPFGEGLDPMTLVAQGAALYAASANLDGRPQQPEVETGHRLWLQHPALSSDLTPHMVGRRVEGGLGPAPELVRLVRQGEPAWQSPVTPLDGQGAFVLSVELQARKPNTFRVEAMTAKGEAVKVSPASLTIVQGLTLSDPPLSRSVGVAQADDTVREYFRRGAPLPARRTHVHHTVESVAKGASSVLKVPIVQGEFDQAHLCRLVGTLEISGAATTASLPAGSAVEVTLELDRGGRLTASGYVPALKQVFSQVAHLLVPDASPEALEASLLGLSDRLAHLPAIQFDRHRARFTGEIGDDAEGLIEEARKDIAAARGGDADAAQKAKRTLLELDARLEKLERAQHWPELDAQAQESFASASSWVSRYGTPQEQKYLAEAGEALERARKAQDVAELQRQLRLVGNLSNAAYYRHPEVWKWSFERAASRVNDSTDLPKAQGLVARGRAAIESGDLTPLRAIVEQLWRLLPVDVQNRRKGHESGVR